MRGSTLFDNGRIYGLVREEAPRKAMLVGAGGRVERLFAEGEPLPPPASANRVDLGGRAVVPAFIDSHAHFMAKAAFSALGIPLARIEGDRILPDSVEAVVAELRERAGRVGRGPVVGFGLCIGALAERRMPRAAELDAVAPARPVIVFSMDGHSSAYSSAALRALGLEGAAPDGLLTGEAHEFGMGKVSSYLMGQVGPAEIARGIAGTVAEALSSGLAAVHCLEGTEGPRDLPFEILAALGPRLPLDLRLWTQYTELSRARKTERRLRSRRAGGCLGWEMDGSVSSRSAAFDSPYLDAPHAGKLYRDPAAAYALVAPFYRAGWQTTAHAIGPRGIESILSAYERLAAEAGDRGNGLRVRIDHFEFPRQEQIERAGRLGLLLAVQPGFAWADDRFLGSYREALPKEVRARQCPLRSLLQAGCRVLLSTDAPVQPFDPFQQIAGAVEHPTASERLTVFEALRAYTAEGAYGSFEEGERGTLEPGKRADFAVLDRDPFAARPGELHSIKAAETWLGGLPAAAPPASLLGFAISALGRGARKL